MDRRDAFEKSWAARHRVSIDEIREHRFETEDGYDLPGLAAHYRTWCAAIESVVVELPLLENFKNDESAYYMLLVCRESVEAASIKIKVAP